MINKKIIIYILSTLLVIITIVFALVQIMKPKELLVEFDTNSFATIEPIKVKKGQIIEKPQNPTKEGYVFIEWTLNGESFDFSSPIEQNLLLKAKWEIITEEKENYTIVFNSQGGSPIQSQVVEKGNLITKPQDPTKEGYTFSNWYLNDEPFDFNSIITKDIELVAKYTQNNTTTTKKIQNSTTKSITTTQQTSTTTTKKITTTTKALEQHTVKFDSQGGTKINSQIVIEGNKVVKPTTPTKEGYNFNEWLLNDKSFNFNQEVRNDITLVAKWTQKNYMIRTTKADPYSPDTILKVYEEGKLINVKTIRYIDGTLLCNGSNTTVSTNDIIGETTFIIELIGGTKVKAELN